ncbi:MAG: ribosomal protein S18-alanine N-acetyltransferase [Hyphococcus sp.]
MTLWTIRNACETDADALVVLEAKVFSIRSWGPASVRESFAAPGVSVLFAEGEASRCAGFAIWRDLGDDAELLTIGVDPAQRRTGAGRALLEAVIKAARATGARRLFLEADAGNTAACSLYENAGFAKVGVRRRYYRNGADAAVMQLLL